MLGPDELQETAMSPSEAIFRIDRESIDTTNAWELKPALLEALPDNGSVLWIDLAGVGFIDSTGLGVLVAVLKEARERDGEVRLMNAGREVRRLLQVTGLEALFESPPARSGAVGRG
jgi:anti-sigma B factor antagonist